MAARPYTLSAAIVPVFVGTALGLREGVFRPWVFLAVLLASVLIQIGANLANDVFDFESGADSTERLGPLRVTQSGLASPKSVRFAMGLVFLLAALLGFYIAYAAGWPILVLGALAIASAMAYTAGPWPLGYNGLGEVFVFLFFGLAAVMGSAYVQTLSVNPLAILASLPVGFTVTAILVVNNLRDIETDRLAGKKTLAVRLGAQWTRREYVALIGLAYIGIVAIWMASGNPWVCLCWLTAPWAFTLTRVVLRGMEGRALNGVLKRTAILHLVFGILLALGLSL